MELLNSLFPDPGSSFPLLAVILGMPMLGAFINGIFGKRLGPPGVRLMALSSVGVSFAAAIVTFLMLRHAGAGAGQHVRFVWNAWQWIPLDTTRIDVAFSADNLSAVMLLVVTGVGFLIHVYATEYMHGDPGYHRFFAYMNLFIFSMLVLVLGDSLPILFVGWEGVGMCSYLLIGFWFEENKNAAAGTKAFIANRIGDFGLLVAMAMILHYVGTLSWQGMDAQAGQLLTRVQLWPFGHGLPTWLPQFVTTPRYANAATIVGLALMLGCAGKSAQIPLYVWLPDAMAGPTPVSALIHAATMVTAGVYLVARMNVVFMLTPTTMMVVASIGAVTAVFAATIGLVQNDIKKVLAYSTVSQLGYMFVGVGMGAFASGIFHVVTHAFFKAALFLSAGSVIHAMHARIHDTDASQDMRYMGGLRKFMPRTFFAYAAATLAIAGLPLTSGFFSKDEILFKALTNQVVASGALKQMAARTGKAVGPDAQQALLASLEAPTWLGKAIFALALIGAVLTAFYMFRSLLLTFFGEFRGWRIVPGWKEHEHEHGKPGEMDGPVPHESPSAMTWPIVILSSLALVAGFLNAGALKLPNFFEHWLEPVFADTASLVATTHTGEALEHVEHYAMAGGISAFLLGAGLAWWIYQTKKGEPAARLAQAFPKLHRWALEKWRVDELYEATVIAFVDELADLAAWFDKWVVDGIIARLTSGVVALAGSVLRLLHTGKVQASAAAMVVGLAALGWFFVMPQGKLVISVDEQSGSYVLQAPPGLGYRYRWDLDNDGKWDLGDAWTQKASSGLEGANSPAPGESRKVRVEIKNVFQITRTVELSVERPKLPAEQRSTSSLGVPQ